MAVIKESIFREYDIRGIVETEFQDDVVQRIASAFATVYRREGKRRVALGMDGRPSSAHIKSIVAKTLSGFGLDVLDIGLVPTPVLYYAVFKMDLDGGLIITASHNPPEYNGIKALVGKEAQSGSQIREIYTLARAGDFPDRRAGRIETLNLIPDYIDTIHGDVHLERPLKVVVDCGNGTGGLTAIPLYEKMGAEVIAMYADVDGHFPNHHPDPTKAKNLADLIAETRSSGADAGIAFDGDADRIGVVDREGTILWGDQMMMIFARDILKKHPGTKIISEVKASETLYSDIRKHGGIPIMWKTGHSLIKKKIVEENAIFAGEMSGHIFFNDRWFGFDDAVYTGARLLEILSRSDDSLTDMIRGLPQAVNTPEIRVETTEEAKFRIVQRITEHFKRDRKVIDIDGARIQFDHGWALVRASNTQPSLVLRFEADNDGHLTAIRAIVEPVLQHIKDEVERTSG